MQKWPQQEALIHTNSMKLLTDIKPINMPLFFLSRIGGWIAIPVIFRGQLLLKDIIGSVYCQQSLHIEINTDSLFNLPVAMDPH